MLWKIVCYNGDAWEAPYQMSPRDAIVCFIKETGHTELDIKLIKNLH